MEITMKYIFCFVTFLVSVQVSTSCCYKCKDKGIRYPPPPPPPPPSPCDYFDDDDDDYYVCSYPKYSEPDYYDEDYDSEPKCYKKFVVEEQVPYPTTLKPFKLPRPIKPCYNKYPKPCYKTPSCKSDGKSGCKSSPKPGCSKKTPGKTVTVDDDDGWDYDYNQNSKKYNEKVFIDDEYRKICKPPTCYPCITYPYTPSTPIAYPYPYPAVINPCPDVSCF